MITQLTAEKHYLQTHLILALRTIKMELGDEKLATVLKDALATAEIVGDVKAALFEGEEFSVAGRAIIDEVLEIVA
ncbi:hypothetical protein [Mesorhizobium retamae]|uniref:Uncharacterized protein n=1 Tax=Mesorhizobium retamae TaxID=2912854 RepID=A0ABS9QRH7_9HYPH|nr:hypothetical protein [Mesorhizobium sp. IRAMC:0171]MCG7509316.1 hypothetical protein [Mesorhizobium sp. IRAMC:0171]